MPVANIWTEELLKAYTFNALNAIMAGPAELRKNDKDVETLAGVYWAIIHDPNIKCPPDCRNNHHDVECPKRAASEAVIELEKRLWHIAPLAPRDDK